MSPERRSEEKLRFPNLTEVLVAGNRGPCGGVNMALEAAFQVLDVVDGREPVYTNWKIVNNTPIMRVLEAKGLVHRELNDIPNGSILFFSAHGIPPRFRERAIAKDLLTIDTTCALVNRVHNEVKRAEKESKHVVYIGAKEHPETVGVLGEFLQPENVTFINIEEKPEVSSLRIPKEKDVVVYSQTTLSTEEVRDLQEELRSAFPKIEIPNRWDICYATDNRQKAVEELLELVDLLVVVGSSYSHNSTELKRKGEKKGKPSFLIDGPEEISERWFTENIHKVGVTSGASVIEDFTENVLSLFRKYGIPITYLDQVVPEKNMTFKLPVEDIAAISARYK